MIWKTHILNFGVKNFKNHMDINQNITLGGMLRRYTRKYPKTHKFITATSIGIGVYVTLMLVLPGCQFPLQKNIKIGTYKFTSILLRLWDYSIISPSPQEYIIKLHELILSAMDNQLYYEQLLYYFYKEIQLVTEQNKKGMKSSNYLDLLLYSEIELQNIIRFSNRSLLAPAVYEYYLWIFETIICKLSNSSVTIKQDKHIKLVYIVLQYLINFGNESQLSKVLHDYNNLIKSILSKEGSKKGDDFQLDQFRLWIAKRAFEQKVFLESLKKIYRDHSEKEIQMSILSIFQGLDNIYKLWKLE